MDGLIRNAPPKPAKGSYLLDRRQKKAAIKAHEDSEKAKVVKRDGLKVCRLVPNCTERERFETAHLDDKGMGGDHGIRSRADRMIRSCFFHHQGVWSLHAKRLRVDCLTERGTDGPIEVWGTDENDQWFQVKRESAPGIVERD